MRASLLNFLIPDSRLTVSLSRVPLCGHWPPLNHRLVRATAAEEIEYVLLFPRSRHLGRLEIAEWTAWGCSLPHALPCGSDKEPNQHNFRTFECTLHIVAEKTFLSLDKDDTVNSCSTEGTNIVCSRHMTQGRIRSLDTDGTVRLHFPRRNGDICPFDVYLFVLLKSLAVSLPYRFESEKPKIEIEWVESREKDINLLDWFSDSHGTLHNFSFLFSSRETLRVSFSLVEY